MLVGVLCALVVGTTLAQGAWSIMSAEQAPAQAACMLDRYMCSVNRARRAQPHLQEVLVGLEALLEGGQALLAAGQALLNEVKAVGLHVEGVLGLVRLRAGKLARLVLLVAQRRSSPQQM